MTRNVAVVTNIPRPYRLALFQVLARQLNESSLGLRVFYTSNPSKHTRRRAEPMEVGDSSVESYVPSATFRMGYERVVEISTGLGKALRQCDPACIVSAGFGTSTMIGTRLARAAGVPQVLWSGAWPAQEGNIGSLRVAVRKRMISSASAFVAYGSAASDYLVTLGAEPARVFCAWNTVDIEGIASLARAASTRRSELKAKYQLATRNLLFVGSLVERKGLRELIASALRVTYPDSDWKLHLVGAGPLHDELLGTVKAGGRENLVRFHGQRPPSDVAELLGICDGLVLPTKREAWGLVINEAMACGLPVIASPWAGAARDLIEDGVSGYVVEPRDTIALAKAMSQLLVADAQRAKMGQAAARAVREKASLEKSAAGFASAVTCALGQSVQPQRA